ncbi:hypothetical protein [Nocardia sp. NRRL S-836]|uniref:hypothetical protein n=1 Tax=Nocardia sp. NRRL S-836 TaxID=1519492 RepID=UPI0006AF759C|nr:hypothetical protein [Nocardia sp. NRRL S-836]KOV87572.1 hypothetical protein ADL03_06650 [Nocardia sp. NRRL S-836]
MLANLLVDQEQADEALRVLRAHGNRGGRITAYRLAWLLAERERLQELRTRADNSDEITATRMA